MMADNFIGKKRRAVDNESLGWSSMQGLSIEDFVDMGSVRSHVSHEMVEHLDQRVRKTPKHKEVLPEHDVEGFLEKFNEATDREKVRSPKGANWNITENSTKEKLEVSQADLKGNIVIENIQVIENIPSPIHQQLLSKETTLNQNFQADVPKPKVIVPSLIQSGTASMIFYQHSIQEISSANYSQHIPGNFKDYCNYQLSDHSHTSSMINMPLRQNHKMMSDIASSHMTARFASIEEKRRDDQLEETQCLENIVFEASINDSTSMLFEQLSRPTLKPRLISHIL